MIFDSYAQDNISIIKSFEKDTLFFINYGEINRYQILNVNGTGNKYDINSKNLVFPNVRRLVIENEFDSIYSSSNFLTVNQFPNLVELYFIGYTFGKLPEVIFKFKKLQALHINPKSVYSKKQLLNTYILPNELFELNDLKYLEIGKMDQFIYLPEKISMLKNLVELRIFANEGNLSCLPVSLINHPRLRKVIITGDTTNQSFNSWYFKDFPFSTDILNSISSNHLNFSYSSSFKNEPFIKSGNAINLKKNLTGEFTQRANNGNLVITGFFDEKNLPTGAWKFYHTNNKIREVRFYNHGKEIGEWEVYDSLGKTIAQYSFKDSSIHFNFYHSNGMKKAELYLNNNLSDSIWSIYDEKGLKLSSITYRNNNVFQTSNLDSIPLKVNNDFVMTKYYNIKTYNKNRNLILDSKILLDGRYIFCNGELFYLNPKYGYYDFENNKFIVKSN